MANQKRDRKRVSKQERQLRQAAAREAERARKQQRGIWYGVAVGVIVILVVFGVMGGNLRNNKKDVKSTTATSSPSGQVRCPNVDGSSARQLFFEKEPGRCIDATRIYKAIFDTSAGTFEAELYPAKAFRAVNNFVFLARYHFYDGLPFHRVSKDIFIQSGDPVAPGITGPGYVFKDDGLPASNAEYVPGSLLFAHERSNENGSQFLIISGPGGQTINPTFPLFGKVTKGIEVINKINLAAGPTVSDPKVKYVIRGIEIEVVRD